MTGNEDGPEKAQPVPRITLTPDFGARWGLWGDRVIPSPPGEADLEEPADFMFSEQLTRRLRAWIDEWQANFSIELRWSRDFDIDKWLIDGDEIVRLIQRELPHYVIDPRYRTYRNHLREL